VGNENPNSVTFALGARTVHTVDRKVLSAAVRKGTLPRNVADAASPPSAKSTKPPEQSWWTPAQLAAFLRATRDEGHGRCSTSPR